MISGNWRTRMAWLTQRCGQVWQGKDYEYVAKKVDNHFEILRRHTELDEWTIYRYIVIVDGRCYSNREGVLQNCERYYEKCKRTRNR